MGIPEESAEAGEGCRGRGAQDEGCIEGGKSGMQSGSRENSGAGGHTHKGDHGPFAHFCSSTNTE